VLQSTISIAALVKQHSKKNACGCYDGSCQFDGAFHFVRDILYHNKRLKQNKAAVENGEEPTEVPMKPIVGCEFFVCEDHKTNRLRIMDTK
jgi:DNA polymerase-3 subunit alpha